MDVDDAAAPWAARCPAILPRRGLDSQPAAGPVVAPVNAAGSTPLPLPTARWTRCLGGEKIAAGGRTASRRTERSMTGAWRWQPAGFAVLAVLSLAAVSCGPTSAPPPLPPAEAPSDQTKPNRLTGAEAWKSPIGKSA